MPYDDRILQHDYRCLHAILDCRKCLFLQGDSFVDQYAILDGSNCHSKHGRVVYYYVAQSNFVLDMLHKHCKVLLHHCFGRLGFIFYLQRHPGVVKQTYLVPQSAVFTIARSRAKLRSGCRASERKKCKKTAVFRRTIRRQRGNTIE